MGSPSALHARPIDTSIHGFRLSFPSAQSLQRRLPSLIFALLLGFGGAFAWAAYREVEDALRLSGDQQVAAAAGQAAELLAQAATTRTLEARQLAADPGIQQAMVTGMLPTDRRAGTVLSGFFAGSPQATIALHDRSGKPLATVRGYDAPSTSPGLTAEEVLSEGISPLHLHDGRVWYHTTTAVHSSNAGGAKLGSLVIQRSRGNSPAAPLIGRLAGDGVVLKIGNMSRDVWTDLTGPVSPPPAASADHPATYKTPEGQVQIGMATAVTGTPWLVWAGPDGFAYAMAHDITDQKRVALELQQRAAGLAESNRGSSRSAIRYPTTSERRSEPSTASPRRWWTIIAMSSIRPDAISWTGSVPRPSEWAP